MDNPTSNLKSLRTAMAEWDGLADARETMVRESISFGQLLTRRGNAIDRIIKAARAALSGDSSTTETSALQEDKADLLSMAALVARKGRESFKSDHKIEGEILLRAADVLHALAETRATISHRSPEKCIAAGCPNPGWEGAALCKEHHDKLSPSMRGEETPKKASADPYKATCEGGSGGPCTSADCEKCWDDDGNAVNGKGDGT